MSIFLRKGPNNLPLSDQLYEELTRLIADGEYAPGKVLPAANKMAEQLALSPTLVHQVYQRLLADGMVEDSGGTITISARRPATNSDLS